MTQKRIWPSLTVLSAVAIFGVALCGPDQIDEARRAIDGWLRSTSTAQACDSCTHGKPRMPELLDLADECPFLLEGTDAAPARPTRAAPRAVAIHAEQAVDRDAYPAASEQPEAFAEPMTPPLVEAPPFDSASPIDQAPPFDQAPQTVASFPADAQAPLEGRELPGNESSEGQTFDPYVTPVSNNVPTVVAARPFANNETSIADDDSFAAASAVPIKASIAADGSIARPAPPAAPALLSTVDAAPVPARPLADPVASDAVDNESTDFRGHNVLRASASPSASATPQSSATPRAGIRKSARSAETPSPASHSSTATSLSGKQSGITLKWTLPDALTLGQASTCQLNVSNGAETDAQSVVVTVKLSPGIRVMDTTPRPSSMQADTLFWQLGDLAAGAASAIQLNVVAEGQGEFAPTASVTCTRSVGAKAPIVEPRLEMVIEGPRDAVVGQPTKLQVKVTNQGTGSATGVAIELQLTEGLEGASGFKPNYAIGTLAAGESRQVQVMITGRDQGSFAIAGKTMLGATQSAAASHTVRMIRPSLAVAVDGPKLRFVDRKAEYNIQVKNPGPGPIENVQLNEIVPAGFRFVEATGGGAFDQQARRVAWFVGHLEPNETANVALHLVAIEAGEHRLQAEAKADYGVAGGAIATTTVRGSPRVVIEVADDDDPVEVDAETVYRVRLMNTGSMPAHGVQFAGEAPREIQLLKINGPVQGVIKGHQFVFPPIETLGPGETASYDVHVKCLKAGQVQFRAYLRTQDNPTPVLEEETTRIYAE